MITIFKNVIHFRFDKFQGRSPRTPQLNQCKQHQERRIRESQQSCEPAPITSYKPYHSKSPESETIYAQPIHPGIGKRSLTQVEISRPKVNEPIRFVQCSPKVVNTFNNLSTDPSTEGERIVKKGLMWVQQDKLFSRWKERFIILTTGYLQIFKKGETRFSDVGTFISKVDKR